MGDIVFLASYKHNFIRVHENLVQHPSINTSIVILTVYLNDIFDKYLLFRILQCFSPFRSTENKYHLNKVIWSLCICVSVFLSYMVLLYSLASHRSWGGFLRGGYHIQSKKIVSRKILPEKMCNHFWRRYRSIEISPHSKNVFFLHWLNRI